MKLGIVGGISCDHIVRAGVGARFDQPGGPGIYASLAAALVNPVQVRLLADLPPEDVLPLAELLKNAGIDTCLSRAVSAVPRLWILDAPEGRRIVPVAVAAGEAEIAQVEATVESDQANSIPDVDWNEFDGVLLCNPVGALPNAHAKQQVRAIDPDQLAIRDHGWRYVEACCTWATVFLPSRVQLRQLGANPIEVAAALRDRFCIDIVAKLDREGAVVLPAGGGMWRVHDPAVSIVDTTGAGDSLAGAVIAARMRGDDWPVALAIGVSAARIALSGWGVDGFRQPVARFGAPFPEIQIEPLSI